MRTYCRRGTGGHFLLLVGMLSLVSCPLVAQSSEGVSTEWDPRVLDGIWHADEHRDISTSLLAGEEISFTPYGAERYRTVDMAKSPANTCLPSGIGRSMHGQFPFIINQGRDLISITFEYQHIYRLIYTDGRTHPEDIYDYPLWFGDSIGRWEGNTLVVDTIGFKDLTWLDSEGLEHSGQLHLTEWFERTGPDTIQWTVQVDDPVFFTQPFKYSEELTRQNTRLMPAYCLENERDSAHMLPTPGARHQNPSAFRFPD